MISTQSDTHEAPLGTCEKYAIGHLTLWGTEKGMKESAGERGKEMN